jgi:hypothetical protein
MKKPPKDNAPDQGGAHFTKLAGGVKKQKKVFRCGVQHTSKFRIEMENAGLGLNDASADTQCKTLLRVLQFVGSRGINTLEGVACGFMRIATRIQELEAEGHRILSLRERVIGADGLVHNGVARYVLALMAIKDDRQGSLDLGEPV